MSAALLLGAIAGEWEVEDMRTHPGGPRNTDRDIVKELVTWMVEEKWIQPIERTRRGWSHEPGRDTKQGRRGSRRKC